MAAQGKSAADELVFILNGMWPVKEKSMVRDHVNLAHQTKLFLSRLFSLNDVNDYFLIELLDNI